MRRNLEPVGEVEADMNVFESFPALLRKIGKDYFGLTIPLAIIRKNSWKGGDLVQVAIKKVSEDECRKLFGFVPSMRRRKAEVVVCPICGKQGSLSKFRGVRRNLDGREVRRVEVCVRHRKRDGFEKLTYHYLSKRRYPQFYADEEDESNASTT